VSARGRERLREAHSRIYRTEPLAWDGRWHLVVLERSGDRNARARCAQALGFLGYGQLAGDTWIAPRASREVGPALAAAGVGWRGFTSTTDDDPAGIAARVWDLDGLAAAYRVFAAAPRTAVSGSPAEAIVARTELVHAWRLFLFTDPGLPAEALPEHWPGHLAAHRFDREAQDLLPGARAWVDAWVGGTVHG
jgi:phenylacetic acid degradation operon negative regulatory protein